MTAPPKSTKKRAHKGDEVSPKNDADSIDVEKKKKSKKKKTEK